MADGWSVKAVEAEGQDDPWSVKAVTPARAKAKRSVTQEVTGFMANVNRGLGIGDELAAGAQTVGNVFSGKTPIADAPNDFRRSMAKQRQIEDSFAADRPKTAALAKGTGMAATALVPAGQTGNVFATGARGLNLATATNAARGASAAGVQAAAYAAADRGSASERLRSASRAARDPITLGLGAAGGILATPKGAKKPPKVDPNVALLSEEGVQLTPGQMRGGIAKRAEDAGTSMPILGDAITDRRNEGVETFVKATVNRALKPVGEALPDNIPAGTEAVKYAGDLLSKGYDEAIPGVIVRADPGFADDARTALANVGTMTPKGQAELSRILDQRITSRVPQNGAMDGMTYKQIQSELDYEVGRYQGSKDPDHQAIGQALAGIQGAMEKAARRQDPKFAARIDALDRGWAELGRIETAASKSEDLSGIFTPKQYAQAIRMNDTRVRRRGVARGEALSQDLAQAGVKVLPSKIGDSGTTTRAAWGMVASAPGAVLGAVTGGGVGALAGIGGTAAGLGAASRAYTPQAVAAANAALNERLPGSARQEALRQLAEMAASDPRLAKLRNEVAAKLSRAAGVAGGARASSSANPFAQP